MRISKKITATTALLVASATLSLSVPAVAATDINLIATYGSIKNSDGLIGLVGEDFADGTWTYGSQDVDTVITAAGFVDGGGCEDSWHHGHLLCDPSPTTNVKGQLTQSFANIGYTSSMNEQDSVGFVVIDLGAKRTFNRFEVYQMHESDGNVTSAQLFISSAKGDTWPIDTDNSWTSVASGTINNGDPQTGDSPLTNADATVFTFAAKSARYIKIYFANDGSYENDGYIEAAGVKLFSANATTADTKSKATLANTGSGISPELSGASLLVVLLGAFVVVSQRRKEAR